MAVKSVLVPYPVDKAYDYDVPAGIGAGDGDYVVVPLGQRTVPGVVWGGSGGDKVDAKKLKSVVSNYDLPPMPEAHRKFLDWAAHYTMTPLGQFLKLSLSVPAALEKPKDIRAYRIADGMQQTKDGLSPAAKRVIDVAKDGLARKQSELAREAGCGTSVIKTLVEKGYLIETALAEPPPCRRPDMERHGATLSPSQKKAADHLTGEIEKNIFCASLLDGVTGSGKTEVYFEAIAAALKAGKQALILLPEIALSNAFLGRFKDRFGCAPALWHSSLSDHQRKVTWRGVASGESRVVVGARSALFLPYKDLGIIVVDEEHDPAYKQEEGVIYNARDMAVVRAHMGKIPVVLVSATPSLETMQNVWLGKYEHLHLPDRHGGAGLPDVHIVDLKADKPERQHFISPTLAAAMKKTITEDNGQVLLFLNRRGYAPLTLCRSCGHRFECPRCTAWLIEHRKTNKLHCHHCGFDTRIPPTCPKCGEADTLVACGPGVERILEEVKETFPEARTVILSSDTAETHDQMKKILDDIREHRIDIIIGTQIIAKGHHFPRLTCVGVVDADLGLSGGDLRASERTFQLLHQVAGRAGREADKGHVYLQTYMPESRVMQALASNNRDEFLEVEAATREAAKMPPFTRLAGIIVSGRDEKLVIEVSKALGQSSPHGQGIQTLGPADAPMYRLRGKFRRRLLVRAEKNIDIQKSIDAWIGDLKIPSTVRVQIDMDPQSFF
ncbi:MAG: primosomal protein N' [Micavibrio aeruginosavorus]|uniref:Replication restart protein PriA n=1 Tax=Micavibrio aeruginosavorus TaxID=349221 RepID=A0A2W5NAW6_9BACT|nr:MAG: primosomal protein N' [Micavibrio aeruginosavorus]